MDLYFRRAVLSSAVIAATAGSLWGQVTFSIDLTKGQSAISPYIYGVNAALNQAPYANMNLTFERQGGNRWTAYNYTNNASNAGSDFQYENDNFLGGGSTPAGAVLPFLQAAQNSNAGAADNDSDQRVCGSRLQRAAESQHASAEFNSLRPGISDAGAGPGSGGQSCL